MMTTEFKMPNLEQKRAVHALDRAPEIDGGINKGDPKGVVKKIPSLVINCGLLSTMAFAKEKGAGYADVFEAFIDYHEPLRGLSLERAIRALGEMDALDLRRTTAEFMAYLSYLRRFV